VRVSRGEADGERDWFYMFVRRDGEAGESFVGGIRFDRAKPGIPATFANGGGSWVEVFNDPGDALKIAPWSIRLYNTADAEKAPTRITSAYSSLPNSDIFSCGGMVTMTGGGTTPRCHPPSTSSISSSSCRRRAVRH
jgi:hypothetical protein